MKWFKLFIIFSLTIAYVGCFKDDQHGAYPFPNDGLKVSTIAETLINTDSQRVEHTYTYSYDSIGRISGIQSDSVYIKFKYNNTLTQKNIYPIAGSAQHYNYYYNNDELLDSTLWFTESTGDTTHIVYIYNTTSQIKKRTEKIISSPGVLKATYQYEYKYDSRGNVESIKGSGGSGVFDESQYAYSDSANYNDISEQVSPDGVNNPDLLEGSVSTYSLSKTGYRYKFDSYGRIEQILEETSSIVGDIPLGRKLLTYTYY